MKTLLILRHAKSDQHGNWKSDRERTLNSRGKEDAPLMGKVLKKYDLLPDRVLCSSSVRTRQTAELFLHAAGFEGEVEFVDAIYEASQATLLSLLKRQDPAESVLLIGHFPGVADLFTSLVGGGNIEYPTAALACIDIEADRWEQLAPQSGRLRWYLIPRLVKEL